MCVRVTVKAHGFWTELATGGFRGRDAFSAANAWRDCALEVTALLRVVRIWKLLIYHQICCVCNRCEVIGQRRCASADFGAVQLRKLIPMALVAENVSIFFLPRLSF
jgi:hypothetical protein